MVTVLGLLIVGAFAHLAGHVEHRISRKAHLFSKTVHAALEQTGRMRGQEAREWMRCR
jgi:hypothetical protein